MDLHLSDVNLLCFFPNENRNLGTYPENGNPHISHIPDVHSNQHYRNKI